MAVPLDAIRAFHNAFRKDMASMDASAYEAARGRAGLELISDRYFFFNEMLVWHANGEEEFVFPALESVAPLVPEDMRVTIVVSIHCSSPSIRPLRNMIP